MRGSRGFGFYLGSFSLTHGIEKCAKLYVGSRLKGLPDIGRFDTLRTLADVERLGDFEDSERMRGGRTTQSHETYPNPY